MHIYNVLQLQYFYLFPLANRYSYIMATGSELIIEQINSP